MSGIFGVFYLDGRPVDPIDLEQMRDILAHRGPDGADIWWEGRVGLGHRMLHTTPESLNEKLPLVARSGDLVITADARIDNRDELIKLLNLTGIDPAEIADSQLILAAYEKWGERCPEKLLGDFAFAIWDGQNQQLFCARDHFGVKPFFYYRSNKIFAFASEIKAILCLSEVPRRLNEIKVAEYLTKTFDDKINTFYQNIFRLPPAHSLITKSNNIQVDSYWSLDPTFELRLASDEEYPEAFREIFAEAIRCRLRSAYPIGSLLSGGLDSSSIVCVARQILAAEGDKPLHTFSAIFPSIHEIDQRIDEQDYMKAVLSAGRIEPHFVEADHCSPLAGVLWHKDEPWPAPNLYMDWVLFEAAQQQGVRAIFSGWDGDTVVSHGYYYLNELAYTRQWKKLVTQVDALAKRFGVSRQRVIWRILVRPLVPDPVVQAWRIMRGRPWSPGKDVAIINPVFARNIGLAEQAQTSLQNGAKKPVSQREAHWRGLQSGLLLYGMEMLGQTAAAASLEPLYPFYDRRLVEFCLALPAEQKLYQGWPRAILRRAMDGILPGEVQKRLGKGRLGTNFRSKLLQFEQENLEKIIFKETQHIEPYVNLQALRKMFHNYIASQPSFRGAGANALTLFTVINLALWLRNSDLAVN